MTQIVLKACIELQTTDGYTIHPKVIELLRAVEKSGSLNAAVAELEMSYSYAWNLLNKTRCKIGAPLIQTRRGGNGGGEAIITDFGKQLMSYCNSTEDDLDSCIGTRVLNVFE